MTAKKAPSRKDNPDLSETESLEVDSIDPLPESINLTDFETSPQSESPRDLQFETPVVAEEINQRTDTPRQTDQRATQTPPLSSPNREPDTTVLVANVGDQPTAKDTLGFTPYVQAIASFLTKDVTKPPLTLSIEGEWGSGKSSFMLQLENALRQHNGKVVRFNAWRYDKDEAMWAAFALEFARKLSNELPFLQRWLAHLRLFLRRFNWQSGWTEIIRLAFTIAVLLLLITLPLLMKDRIVAFILSSQTSSQILTTALQALVGAGGALAYVALIAGLGMKLHNLIGNPLKIDLKQHLDTPNYQSRVAFIEQFHSDFAKVVDVYGGGDKVYVFIDDLDRCEVPKAADLMQALNLMISDSSRLIFIIGMDREKVAAGLAVKHEKLLPYLAPSSRHGDNPKQFDPMLGLEYGYSFIEKFVQLPFLVPQASSEQVDSFLKELFGPGAVPANNAVANLAATGAGKEAEESVVDDSKMVGEILKIVAPTFDYNPRRLKQFINAFRLKTFIASRTGLFDEPAPSSPFKQLTTYQLGKFVAIGLRWPMLLADLDNHRYLLRELERMVAWNIDAKEVLADESGPHSEVDPSHVEVLERWRSRTALRELLRFGRSQNVGSIPEKEAQYSLEYINVNKLLQVSSESINLRPTGSPGADAKDPA